MADTECTREQVIAMVAGMTDNFKGDTPYLILCIDALLKLDEVGAWTPHRVPGHARTLLESAAIRLAAIPCPESGKHCRWVKGECQTCGIVARLGNVDWCGQCDRAAAECATAGVHRPHALLRTARPASSSEGKGVGNG
jgi:endonuclease YncB( thermonuclease family)